MKCGPCQVPRGCVYVYAHACVSVCHSGGSLFILGSHFRCTSIPCLAVCLCAYYHWQSDECTLTEPLIKLSPNQVTFFFSLHLSHNASVFNSSYFSYKTEISLFLFSLFCMFSLSNMTYHSSVFMLIPFFLYLHIPTYN